MMKGLIIYVIGCLGIVYAMFSDKFLFYYILGVVVAVMGGIIMERERLK